MQKKIYISGLFSALLLSISAILKIKDFPLYKINFAITIIGVLIFCCIFLPLLFLQKWKETKQRIEKIEILTGVISTLLIIIGIFFRIMTWNIGRIILFSGIFLFGLFIIIMFINSRKETDKTKKYNILNYIIFIMVFASLSTLLYNNRVGKRVFLGFIVLDNQILKTNNSIFLKNKLLTYKLDSISKNNISLLSNYNIALKINKLTDSLLYNIRLLRTELISNTEGINKQLADTINLSNIHYIENYSKPMKILIGTKENKWIGKGNLLKIQLNKYFINLKNLIPSPDKENINFFIDTEDVDNRWGTGKISWEWNSFLNSTLAADIIIIDKITSDILYTQYNALNYLYLKSTITNTSPKQL
jgi:hypothetical protein